MLFEVKNFSCYIYCNSRNMKEYLSACDSFSYTFSSSNVYFLSGEIDCGGTAFCAAISQKNKPIKIFDSQFFIDETPVELKDVKKLTCNVHQELKLGLCKNISFYNYIAYLTKKYKYKTTPEELFEIFGVSKEYFSRRIKNLGQYRSVFLAMKGVIEGKRIFTTSWQGQLQHEAVSTSLIAKAMVKTDNIFIIPASEKMILQDKENYISLNMLSHLKL